MAVAGWNGLFLIARDRQKYNSAYIFMKFSLDGLSAERPSAPHAPPRFGRPNTEGSKNESVRWARNLLRTSEK